jgi:hypothetical protein
VLQCAVLASMQTIVGSMQPYAHADEIDALKGALVMLWLWGYCDGSIDSIHIQALVLAPVCNGCAAQAAGVALHSHL